MNIKNISSEIRVERNSALVLLIAFFFKSCIQFGDIDPASRMTFLQRDVIEIILRFLMKKRGRRGHDRMVVLDKTLCDKVCQELATLTLTLTK